jgi:two-component system nitrate/nitrite response regulator NarL
MFKNRNEPKILPMKSKIILADDHILFAESLQQIINSKPNLEVVEIVNNGKLLLQVLNRITPELIILDVNMPFLNGIEAAKIIKKNTPQIKILVLSMRSEKSIIRSFFDLNVEGFLPKDICASDLIESINDVLSGKKVYNEDFFHQNEKTTDKEKLITRREKEIIQLIIEGFSSKEIAEQLLLSKYPP